MCVGGLSDSARGGWINAKQIINSESGADMYNAPPPPPHSCQADIMRHRPGGSWTESRPTTENAAIMSQLIFRKLFRKDNSCLLIVCNKVVLSSKKEISQYFYDSSLIICFCRFMVQIMAENLYKFMI